MTLNAQARHYDEIIDDYDRHYYDRYSLQYRERFILRPLLRDVDLSGKRVADLASGSGETSLFLMQSFPGIQLTGFDISPDACRRYRDKVGRPANEIDLTRDRYEGPRFDAAVIMGGLHHCVADLSHTLHTIATMIEPGGTLLFFEPNREYVLEPIRQFWYRQDRYFDEANEAALSHDSLLKAGDGSFVCDRLTYFGGPAFFLVFNSLVFRLTPSLKSRVSPILLAAEALYNQLPTRWVFASFLARWRRT